jgi:hypothetical protein
LILSYTYRDPANLKTIDSSIFDTYYKAYKYYQQIYTS